MKRRFLTLSSLFLVAACVPPVSAQPPFGGPGMFGGGDREILKQFDADGSGWLNEEERAKARTFINEDPAPRRGPGSGGPGGPGFGGPGGPGFGGPGGPGGRQFGPPREFGPPFGFGPPEVAPPEGGFGPPPGSGPPPPGFERPERFGMPRGGRPLDGDGAADADFPPPERRGFGPGGGPAGMRRDLPDPSAGARIEKDSVTPLHAELYDPNVLRTIFIDFAGDDWEAELEDFHGTDVDVAAILTVDGETYRHCGIRFRGMSSYSMVPRGYKRSFNISVDMAHQDQRIGGYKTLNLLNSAGDDSMMSTVLYSHIARRYMPVPKANFVRVVINGEDWGIYTNVQQFNKEFIQENYGTDQGARWKVIGSPRGGGGLDYRGEDPANYQHPYDQKSGGKKALARLIELCRILEQTPADQLPAALESIVDVEELLWFLAIDNALMNSDGYWVRASDYSIYLDPENKFHFIAHDMNEAFRAVGGPGMGGPGPGGPGPGGFGPGGFGPGGAVRGGRGGPGRGGPVAGPREGGRFDGGDVAGPPAAQSSPLALDPLIGLDDPSKPLRSKVLAVPEYRQQYLNNVARIAQESLDWNQIGPFVASQVQLIDSVVKIQTRALGSYESFRALVDSASPADVSAGGVSGHRGGQGSMNLRQFADGRRAFLLNSTRGSGTNNNTR